MTIGQFRAVDLAHIGVQGVKNIDYFVLRDCLEVQVTGWSLVGNPALAIETAQPGDLLYIYSDTSFAPRETIGAVAVNPVLYRHGIVSAPTLITERTAGPFVVLFRCEVELDLRSLEYLAEVYNLGRAQQQGSKIKPDVDGESL